MQSALGHDREVEVSVRDRGIGIHAGDLPHIFDKYYRATQRTARSVGLGLYLVRSIIERHGGRVSAESAPDRGRSGFDYRCDNAHAVPSHLLHAKDVLSSANRHGFAGMYCVSLFQGWNRYTYVDLNNVGQVDFFKLGRDA